MKIVHIIECFAGGTYTYLKNLSDFFDKQNNNTIKLYIIYSDKRKDFNKDLLSEFNKNVTLIKVPMEQNISLYRDLYSSLKIRKLLNKIEPDIVHLHSSKAGVIGRLASFSSKKKHKLYYTPHGYSFLRQDISKSKQKIFKSIEYLSQKILGGTTIACGDTEYNYAKKIGPSLLVRNGIDFNKIEKFYNLNSNDVLSFGIVGRIMPQKNPKLFNEIAKKYPNYNFIWIGDGDLKSELTEQNIKITGWISSEKDLLNHINTIDVLLHTSLWEGLPLSILEAMALKKPILATNTFGNIDIVKNNINGFLFNNTHDIDKYIHIFNDKSTYNRLSNQAYIVCKEQFDCFKNFNQLLKIYFDSD